MLSPNHVIISVNPKAGRRSPMLRAEALAGHLREKGFDTQLLTDLNEVAEKAKTLYNEQCLRCLVGVGGDGTAATLVNLTAPGTPVTLLAAGTANLLAKHYRLPSRPKGLAEMIATGQTLTLDAGRATSTGPDGQQKERLFLVMVSCGFDADVVNEVHSQREERYRTGHKSGAHISYFSYTKPILKSLFGYNFPQMKVEVSDDNEWQTVEKQARWAFVFNMNRYGWGLPLAPFAKEADGLLDHVLFRGSTVFHGFLYVAFAQFRQHVRFSWTRFGQSPRYRITPNDTSTVVPFQLDGDPGGALPLEIEVIPDRLTLFVPKHTSPQEPEV